MELKPGYKQTEVGVFPEDWEIVPLGDHFKFKNGLNKAKKYFGFGTPIVNYMDVFQHPSLRLGDIQGCVDVNTRELKAYEVRQGDVFFTRTSETVEEIGVASAMMDEPKDMVFSGFVLRARPIDQSFDNNFKGYCFASAYFRKQVTARASYTTQALTNGRSLSVAFISKPPLHEQKTIASALGDVDALLDGLDRLIAKKRDLKQAAMQRLLTGETRLPGFEGEWEVKRVLDLGEVVTGGTPRTDVSEFWGDEYPWITPTDISSCRDMFSSERGLTQKGLGVLRPLPANSVLVTCIASIGKNCILKSAGACNQQINALIPNKESCAEFLYYLFEASKQYLLANAGITATSIISKAAFAELTFRIPSFPEQTAIATVLSDMDAEIAALEQRCNKTKDIKQAMMQELLTGKTRLVTPGGSNA